ncbi:hypothetical protein DPV69_08735 [Pedobacter chitinilyticus]|uniref:Uncharacterized protein n=1 Tax=Pedobacter chitinilyticus TaxID=2233776 RepID=A0A3S3SSM8_9SPHI|nr:hypothetical protein DPV69_08735 [Pedobacter chitinilyticus]
MVTKDFIFLLIIFNADECHPNRCWLKEMKENRDVFIV